MSIAHGQQQERWEREHTAPQALLQMDSRTVSGSIPPFLEYINQNKLSNLVGLEMGCGKGRNVCLGRVV